MEASKASRHRVSISGMLKYLGVSRSGYRAFLRRKPSATQKRRARVEKEIQQIYDDSKQNYGSPKITYKLRDKGEIISQRTVAKYMRGMGIRAQWVKHWIATTKDSGETEKRDFPEPGFPVSEADLSALHFLFEDPARSAAANRHHKPQDS